MMSMVDHNIFVRGLFDQIAPGYDLLNRINSFCLDLLWRRDLVKHVAAEQPELILDLAAGTGDLSIELAKSGAPKVVAADISIGMLEQAVLKARKKGLHNVKITVADALDLPFEDNHFDAITCAFGVRNFESILEGYKEAYRVLKPNGIMAVLELCEPENPILRRGYHLHANHIIPLMGQLIGRDRKAYDYLVRSIKMVPNRSEMQALMDEVGFKHTYHEVYSPGVCALYVGYKPSEEEQQLFMPVYDRLKELKASEW